MRNNFKSIFLHRFDDLKFEDLWKELEIKAFKVNTSFSKRIFDILFSLFIIVCILSWLYPLVYILIKLGSGGQVIFKQDRVGLNGRLFKCYKFRTMTEENVRYMYTPVTKEDKRITFIGRWLRKTNLDELPQFINVLKGDMSIVGPRPHAIAFHHTYASFIEFIEDRLLIKPGITGLAQIRGYRGDVKDFSENKLRTRKRVSLDILYIKIWSFKTDIWIIYTTMVQIIKNKKQIV